MSKQKDESMFKLGGGYRIPSVGLRHLREPPNIEGKHDHGEKPSLTFYFNTKEEVEEVRKFFRTGASRVPDGRKLLRFIKSAREDFDWL